MPLKLFFQQFIEVAFVFEYPAIVDRGGFQRIQVRGRLDDVGLSALECQSSIHFLEMNQNIPGFGTVPFAGGNRFHVGRNGRCQRRDSGRLDASV